MRVAHVIVAASRKLTFKNNMPLILIYILQKKQIILLAIS
jgi:hypothetical protein